MHNPKRPRGFEDRLLRELKIVVNERTQTMTTEEPTPAPRFSRGKKVSLAGALGAAALGVGAFVALPALTASPAYAVEPRDDGTVYVEVNSPQDADGLEETLAEYGIKALVDFPPDGKMCNLERYRPAELPPDEWQTVVDGTDVEGNIFLGFEVNPEHYPLGGDTTLVIEINEGYFAGNQEANMIALVSAVGEVGECDPVDHDLPVGDEGAPEPGDGGDGEPVDDPMESDGGSTVED